jgi:hypothetical protein
MAKSKKKQVQAARPYVDRLINDSGVHRQLSAAGGHFQQVYHRVGRRKAKAAEDKQVYAHIREGVVALRKAGERVAEPPRRRGSKVLVLAVVAGAGAALFANKDKVAGALAGGQSPEYGADTTTTSDPFVPAA